MTTEHFNSSDTWLCPDGVTSVDVQVWGGGAGGGSDSDDTNKKGGGGGAFSAKTVTVTPGNSYTVHVGAGGAAGTASGSAEPTVGDDSYFVDAATVMAKGGKAPTSGSVGLGGLASDGVGTTKYSGGDGAGPAFSTGGGGGSSASPVEDGIDGSLSTGGDINSGGGDGGNGGSGGANGHAGSQPGGGGGGGSNGSSQGGAGGDGRVSLTYVPAEPEEHVTAAGPILGALIATCNVSFSPPAYTAGAAVTLGPIAAGGIGSASEGDEPETAVAAAVLGALQATANAQHTTPTYEAGAAVNLAPIEAAAHGQSAWLYIASAAGATLPAIQAAANVENVALTNTAQADVQLGGIEAAAGVENEGMNRASAGITLGAIVAQAVATFRHPFRAWFARNANVICGRGSRN